MYFKERLDYDHDTGKLYWKFHPGMRPQWNGRYAGTEAFTTTNGDGYKTGCIDSVHYLAHRICWMLYYGEWPKGDIDHEDHDRANNRITNLFDTGATTYNNQQNATQRRDNKSRTTGVHWNKARQRWRARIMLDGADIDLGFFKSYDEAIQRRKAAEFLYGFHENHGEQSDLGAAKRPASIGDQR